MTISHQAQKPAPDFSDATQWRGLTHCPLCGNDEFSEIVQARDRHYGNSGLFPVVECDRCGLNFLNPTPTVDYLSCAYPVDYYAYQAPSRNLGHPKWVKGFRKLLRSLTFYHSHETGDPKFEKAGTMLDIGCGSGTFLASMRDKGWEVEGVELDGKAADRGLANGLAIFAGTLDEARFPSAKFDYVRSNHSFEHIHNPKEILREIRRILKDDGRVFIGVPNVKSFAAKLYGTYWWYLGAPVHPFGYSPSTLTRMLEEQDFTVECVKYNSNAAGILGSLQLYLNRNNGKLGEDGPVFRSKLLMLVGYWAARMTDFVHTGDCIELIARPK